MPPAPSTFAEAAEGLLLCVLAVNTGPISVLRSKPCTLLRAKTSALLRHKTCAVLRARACALYKANTKETTVGAAEGRPRGWDSQSEQK